MTKLSTSLYRSGSSSAQSAMDRPAPTTRGGVAILGVFFLALLGLAMIALAAVLPVGARAIDPAVLREAGRGTPALAREIDAKLASGKPGTADLLARAESRLWAEEGDFPVKAVQSSRQTLDSSQKLWGGQDPFLEQIFQSSQPRAKVNNPPIIPLFIPRESRHQLRSFLASSRNPAVQTVMATLDVAGTDRFMPVGTAAGQPLEATILLTGLLLQGNHFSPAFGEEIRQLADLANKEDRLGGLETVYLDIFALGVRLQWQPLVDLLPLLPDRQALRRTAHLTQVLGEDWPLFVAGALWVGNPTELSQYLVKQGDTGLSDLRQAMQAGEGAVRLLVARQQPVEASALQAKFSEIPVLFPQLALTSPEAATAAKISLLFAGLLTFLLALNLAPQWWSREKVMGRPFSFTLLQSGLLATALALIFFVFSEPLLADTGQKSEFRIALPVSFVTTTQSEIAPEEENFLNMDQNSLIPLASFLAIQLIIYMVCWIKMMEIRRQPIPSRLKMSLLENEDNLFDSGLYIGLAGTVGSMIFLALGHTAGGMMAAYSSTLFGIVFVALFKICHLRPYRRRLILESQASGD